MTSPSVDILVVGAGMAGLSIAAHLAASARVMVVEQESQPGYHATGRSVAFWSESYGGPGVQPLTSASGPLLAAPDPAFSAHSLLAPRGCLHLGRPIDRPLRAALLDDFARSGVVMTPLDRAGLDAALPGLRDQWTLGLSEPSCSDIDAAGLLSAYRAMARRGGAQIALDCRLLAARPSGTGWLVETSTGPVACAIIVNAAGAWVDDVAARAGVGPLGFTPYRRTVAQLRCPTAPAEFPLVVDLAGDFYFKPEGQGRIWLSPHDETPDSPRDVAPEELDVAIAIDRFEKAVDWPIEALEHRWAGLRTFAPDRLPVYGFDPRAKGFFWFAGQGGFGIQTAPAAALLGAALVLGEAPAALLAGVDAALYAPGRLIA